MAGQDVTKRCAAPHLYVGLERFGCLYLRYERDGAVCSRGRESDDKHVVGSVEVGQANVWGGPVETTSRVGRARIPVVSVSDQRLATAGGACCSVEGSWRLARELDSRTWSA